MLILHPRKLEEIPLGRSSVDTHLVSCFVNPFTMFSRSFMLYRGLLASRAIVVPPSYHAIRVRPQARVRPRARWLHHNNDGKLCS